MSWLGDVFNFERFNAGEMWKKIKQNPERLLIGAADPFSSKMWGKALGKDYTPIINQWGGASDDTYDKARAAGINTGPGAQAHQIAQTIASIYAGGAAAGALGGGSGAASGAGSAGGAGGGGWGAFGPGGGAWTGTGALSGTGGTAGGFGSLGIGAGATGNTAAAGWGAFGPGSSAWSGAGGASGGSGFSLNDLMQRMQQMQGGGSGGQQDQPIPGPSPGAMQAQRAIEDFARPYKGETDYASKRRKRRRGFLGDA